MKQLSIITMSAFVAMALSGCTGGAGDAEIYGESGLTESGDLIGTLNDGWIQQAGSSTVLPIAQAWADDFGTSRGVQVKVAGGGSGAGGKGICKGELDIGDQSRPMKSSEFDLCARFSAIARDKNGSGDSGEPADARPVAHLRLRDEIDAFRRVQHEDVEP